MLSQAQYAQLSPPPPFLEEKIKQESESQTDTYKVKVSSYYAEGAVSYWPAHTPDPAAETASNLLM